MRAYTLTHLTDAALLSGLVALVARDRATTAALLAHIAEVDARRLYLPAGYESMHAYCVDGLRLSEDAAYKRIQAARAAREFPTLFGALADGRLNLTAVCLLAPHLTAENVDGLVAASVHQRNTAIRELLATRISAERVVDPPLIAAISVANANPQLAAQQVEKTQFIAISRVDSPESPQAQPRTQELIALRFNVPKSTHDKLLYAQALLSHAVPSGDQAQVLDRALDALIACCEKKKFGATARPRSSRPRPSATPRHIPAHVKRAVWSRDQGRCTFVGENGHRCGTRRFLEFDHIDPIARGGTASIDRMRLRCRAHNQYEAERTFGAEFMATRREEARRAAMEARAAAEARATAEERAAATAEETRAIISGLRHLGCRADEARRAAEHAALACDGGTLEERLRTALRFLRPPRSTVVTKAQRAEGVPLDPPEHVPVGA